MKTVCIITQDARLFRHISLCLPPFLSLSDDEKQSFLIIDTDSCLLPPDNGKPRLFISRVPRRAEKAGSFYLTRPFSQKSLVAALTALTEKDVPVLTPTEEKLFRLLREAQGAPVARSVLLREVWGEDGNDRLLNLYIHYLREKLEKDGTRRIFSARGKGYFYKC